VQKRIQRVQKRIQRMQKRIQRMHGAVDEFQVQKGTRQYM
jgi:hypothetical protein